MASRHRSFGMLEFECIPRIPTFIPMTRYQSLRLGIAACTTKFLFRPILTLAHPSHRTFMFSLEPERPDVVDSLTSTWRFCFDDAQDQGLLFCASGLVMPSEVQPCLQLAPPPLPATKYPVLPSKIRPVVSTQSSTGSMSSLLPLMCIAIGKLLLLFSMILLFCFHIFLLANITRDTRTGVWVVR